MKYDLGIDIGGTFIKYALVDEQYNIIEKWKVPTIEGAAKDEFYDFVAANCKDISRVKRIGVSAPGVIDAAGNVKSYAAPNVRIMHGTNVNDELKKRTGKATATINDAKAAGLCELKIGNAQNTDSSAFLIIGTGTGGCICDKENVIYGRDSLAGEFHFLPFMNFAQKSLDVQGNYASMTALLKIYNSQEDHAKAESGEEITAAYLAEESAAREAIEEWTTNIVVQLLTITVFYNPDVICVGGGISEEQWFIELVENKYRTMWAAQFKGAIELTTKIRPCKYNNDANILGAIINGKRREV